MKLWVPGTEDPTLAGLPPTRSGLYISCAYPPAPFRNTAPVSRRSTPKQRMAEALMAALGRRPAERVVEHSKPDRVRLCRANPTESGFVVCGSLVSVVRGAS